MIELRRAHGSVRRAVEDWGFVEALHGTLLAWGSNSASSRLRTSGELSKALRFALINIEALERFRIDGESVDTDATADAIWRAIRNARVVDENAQLVAGTKTLHLLLPELVPPMDREHTARFFGWQEPQFQSTQERCFKQAFVAFAAIAQRVNARQFVGSNRWNTSISKVLDNAVVGMLKALDDVVQTAPGPTATKRNQKRTRS